MAQEKIKANVSPRKKKAFAEIIKLVTTKSTLLISSSQNIPSAQLQKIRSQLKNRATMKVVKKQIMIKALENIEKTKKGISPLKAHISENCILIFSDNSAFELAGILEESRIAKKAKAGQISPRDIEVEAGPTDMPAGPMISELSSVGLKVGVENGKIAIKQASIIVKKDAKISDIVASTLIKLNIMPFNVGLETIAAYDSKEDKVYAAIKINKSGTYENLKSAFSNSRALAFSIVYPAKEIISMIIAKASINAKAIDALVSNVSQPTPNQS
ncbi:MAG: 50S ribosomal protein L10 [archaeon]